LAGLVNHALQGELVDAVERKAGETLHPMAQDAQDLGKCAAFLLVRS
jgi:hypothetical protein